MCPRLLPRHALPLQQVAFELHSLGNVSWSMAVFGYLTPERFRHEGDGGDGGEGGAVGAAGGEWGTAG